MDENQTTQEPTVNPEVSLEKYSNAVAALKDHQAANQKVFSAHEQLLGKLIDAENELRDAVAVAARGVENGQFSVSHIPQTQTWADIDELDQLIAQGKIPGDVRGQIVKTQQRPARITIHPQKL